MPAYESQWSAFTAFDLDQVAEHDRALKGNNGTIGVIARVANSTGTMDDLGTTIRGRGDDPGLVGKIDKRAKTGHLGHGDLQIR
jgi:hypothetical protein